MNAAFFLTPKSDVAYLYSDYSIRQGLERLKRTGYTSIPVLNREGQYLSMIREGDFLYYLMDRAEGFTLRELENVRITEIMKPGAAAEPITVSIEKIIERALNQNFVPLVDDGGYFIGIVTRGRVMKYLNNEIAKNAFAGV